MNIVQQAFSKDGGRRERQVDNIDIKKRRRKLALFFLCVSEKNKKIRNITRMLKITLCQQQNTPKRRLFLDNKLQSFP